MYVFSIIVFYYSSFATVFDELQNGCVVAGIKTVIEPHVDVNRVLEREFAYLLPFHLCPYEFVPILRVLFPFRPVLPCVIGVQTETLVPRCFSLFGGGVRDDEFTVCHCLYRISRELLPPFFHFWQGFLPLWLRIQPRTRYTLLRLCRNPRSCRALSIFFRS